MIPKETVDRIFELSRIDEVVGEFVTLKKRGANLIGLCPFHNEKTPSFNVNPSKGIYKCFGCGKGGNSVNFIMEHEHLSYPESLKWIANKYNIEVPQEEQTPDQVVKENERESIYLVNGFVQKHFAKNLHDTEEGKAIGLTYFQERGFTDETILKFQLGYSMDAWRAMTDSAISSGYKLEYLVKAGLTIQNEENKDKFYDRFKGRVIFPIHNTSGRVIGFGGRTLKNDKKVSKYINSPETEIYHKGKVLYGLFFAKKEIALRDVCYLVEGYTDVTSMHQAGIENVVASSGTALTVDQIRLIRRYTNNITILYDGDSAGIKASFRGIDLILEEGMNVRVLLFPDGDDPDSYSKKLSSTQLKRFIDENTKDFIRFKTELLLGDMGNDPIKKAGLIREIVDSIALIPDGIMRSVFVKDCSVILSIDESTLLRELNGTLQRRNGNAPANNVSNRGNKPEANTQPASVDNTHNDQQSGTEFHEREIVRLLLNYGNRTIPCEGVDPSGNKVKFDATMTEFLLNELDQDSMEFRNPLYRRIIDKIRESNSGGINFNISDFTNNPDPEISGLCVDLISSRYQLSDWDRHSIQITTEDAMLDKTAIRASNSFKLRSVEIMVLEKEDAIKIFGENGDDENVIKTMTELRHLQEAKKYFSKELGRVVVR